MRPSRRQGASPGDRRRADGDGRVRQSMMVEALETEMTLPNFAPMGPKRTNALDEAEGTWELFDS